MNIFVLDRCPRKAAKYSCDKHVVKMIVETAQMLCYALYRHGEDDLPYALNPLHSRHPCTVWCGDTRANFLWLVRHGLFLSEEYTVRYGKIHKSKAVILTAAKKKKAIPPGSLTPFALAMPDQYKCADPVESYRKYYLGEKMYFAKWKTKTPYWVNT